MNRAILYLLIVILAAAGFIFTGSDTQEDVEILVENRSDVVMQVKLDPHEWSSEELGVLQSLSLDSLPVLPPDPSNVVADNSVAANFGYQLFFDVRLSSNGEVSCASCHKPELKFTDGLPRSLGVGVTPRKSMTIIGTAHSPWLFWDGRKDSQWSQALGPLENAEEHGANRSFYVHIIANDESYRGQYESLFGKIPDLSDATRFPPSAGPVPDPEAKAAWDSMAPEDKDVINGIFVNLGKSIAAYERLLMPGKSRFDDYVESALSNNRQQQEEIFTESEARGLDVFVGKGQCINCHNGPLLTNNAFHNTGIPPALDLPPDFGRIEGVYMVKEDPFNCLGEYSDVDQEQCEDLIYTRTEGQEIIAAFKTPTLRNVTETSPYMHSGQIPNLTEVIRHYNAAPLAVRGHSELATIDLTTEEMRALEDFLHTLSSPVDVPAEYLQSPWPEVLSEE